MLLSRHHFALPFELKACEANSTFATKERSRRMPGSMRRCPLQKPAGSVPFQKSDSIPKTRHVVRRAVWLAMIGKMQRQVIVLKPASCHWPKTRHVVRRAVWLRGLFLGKHLADEAADAG